MSFGFHLGALRARLTQFRRAKKGAIAILFALAVLPLIFLVGLAIDFRTMQTARSDMQNSLDSAVLAAARTYNAYPNLSDTAREDKATTAGKAMFKSNLRDAGPPLTDQLINFTYDKATNKITGTGFGNSHTAFGGLMSVFGGTDITDVRIKVYGEVQGSDPRRLEIVLALDNTGSMFELGGSSGEGRFNLMRSAAKNFVNTLFDNQTLPNKMYVGVIPWTTTVNINMEKPVASDNYAKYDAPDVGFDGTREVPPTPFQTFKTYLTFPPGTTTSNGHSILVSNPPDAAWATFPGVAYDGTNAKHVAAFNALFAPVTWRGCIRSNSTEGSLVASLTDSPPSPMRWPVDAVEPLLKTFSSGGRLMCGTGSNSANDTSYNSYIDQTRPCRATSSGSDTTISACVSDAYEFSWINAHSSPTSGRYCSFKVLLNLTPATPTSRTTYNSPWMAGPNVNCPSSMLGLSASREQILKSLNRMYPNSDGTQQEVGLLWGLRMLSPNSSWVSFFGHDGANTPAAYNTDSTRKVLILLTDGDNNAPSLWEGYWGCTQSGTRNSGAGRSGDTPKLPVGANACWTNTNVASAPGNLTDAKLDTLTKNYCKAIRDTYHIELYTIGVDISSTAAKQLLRDCVADDKHAKIITGAELDETFLAIANDTLRLVK